MTMTTIMDNVCPVCQIPLQAIWICSMSRCPKKLQTKMTEIRQKYIEDQEQFGRPDRAEKDPHHERF